jgi:hypothetical protein
MLAGKGGRAANCVIAQSEQQGAAGLVGRAFKVSVMLDPTSILGLEIPPGVGCVPFIATAVARQELDGMFSAKVVQRAQTRIVEFGAGDIAVVFQAKLAPNNRLKELGIAVQQKGMFR